MSDNPFRDYTPDEMTKMFSPLINTICDLAIEGLGGNGNIVISKREYDSLNKANAALAEANKRIAEMQQTITELCKQRDTAVQQRDASRAAAQVNRAEDAALKRENEDLKRQIRNLQGHLRAAEKVAASVRGMERNPDPRYNKLHKDYVACKNQRDSFKKTIAAQQATIGELENEIAAIKAGSRVEVPYVIVDGVNWDAQEVRQMRNVSVARAAQINELTNKLNAACEGVTCIKVGAFHYTEGEVKGLLNTIEQLRRQNENLKQSKPTILVKGKYMTVAQVEGLMDRNLKYAAEIDRLNAIHKRVASTLRGTTTSVKRERAKRREMQEELQTLRACKQYVDAQGSMISAENRAASYQDQMNQWREKFVAADAEVKSLKAEVKRLKGPKTVESSKATIEVEPRVVELIIRQPEGTTIVVNDVRVEACLIPQMANDLVSKTTEIAGLHKIIDDRAHIISNKDSIIAAKDCEIASLKQRNQNQHDSLNACDTELIQLRKKNAEQGDLLVSKDAELNRLRIELRLTKGRLNEQKQKPSVPIGSPIIKAGQAYITTDIGLIPITSEGVRTLSDAYHALKGKVDSLSDYLQHWATD